MISGTGHTVTRKIIGADETPHLLVADRAVQSQLWTAKLYGKGNDDLFYHQKFPTSKMVTEYPN